MTVSRRLFIQWGAVLIQQVTTFKEHVRAFYYQACLVGYTCSTCNGQMRMTRDDAAECSECKNRFDPTSRFQTCDACGGPLKRLLSHYACTRCGNGTRSHFAFDPAVLDRAYFAKMMQKSRQRKKQRFARMQEHLLMARSERVLPEQMPDLDEIPGLGDSLDTMAGLPLPAELIKRFLRDPALDMQRYREHIMASIDVYEVLFDQIPPLLGDRRRDRIFRFVTVVFMCHEREIELIQHNQILVVARHEPDSEG